MREKKASECEVILSAQVLAVLETLDIAEDELVAAVRRQMEGANGDETAS